MAIVPLSPVSSLTGIDPVARSARPQPAGGEGFADALAQGVDRLAQMQRTTDDLAVKAATGDLTDVHDYMVASAQSSAAVELTVAVRNRAVEAFTEIMRMQV